jgi:hypothetical protein
MENVKTLKITPILLSFERYLKKHSTKNTPPPKKKPAVGPRSIEQLGKNHDSPVNAILLYHK